MDKYIEEVRDYMKRSFGIEEGDYDLDRFTRSWTKESDAVSDCISYADKYGLRYLGGE